MAAFKLPIIDLTSPDSAHDIVAAAREYGFFFVRNTSSSADDLAQGDIDQIFNISKGFFQLPVERKEEVAINSIESGSNRGWLAMERETLDPQHQKRGDLKEAFNISEYRSGHANQPLGPLSPHEAYVGEFASKCHGLCRRILELFAIGLQIPTSSGGPSYFLPPHDPTTGPSGSILRLLYYPPLSAAPSNPPATDDVRAGAHSDYGSLTLLFQRPGESGLEIQLKDGSWMPVPSDPLGLTSGNPSSNLSTVISPSQRPEGNDGEDSAAHGSSPGCNAILINVGDLLSFWTNGLLRSAVHRVVLPAEASHDRYSIAYFCHPVDSAELRAVPSELVGEYRGDERDRQGFAERVGEKAVTAKEHLERRLRETYGSGKEEGK
ncbi:Clavaminate synthase-like protein [Eremomyces bilateralis CBS 781.70]|uniref:Clavaminate synthase-like protein n=1 Tax=Eremomyces bilateralis CBS 781.70 TaxID=1392243 RepID=A0A6G1GCB8_9PEZI|nr:Clavaminate synthase-like protein [Eremomyces bilateralis CBS 781.70]KAF1815737.1 Clavaminate synthase-like protein [Eremomyces bilateralis CBS 781.70]